MLILMLINGCLFSGCSDPVREFGSIVKDPQVKAMMLEQMKTYQLEGSLHDPAIRIFMGYCFEMRLDGIDARGSVLGAANSMSSDNSGGSP